MKRHVRNMQNYQLPVVVAINEFVTDTEAEIQMLEQCCKEIGVPIARTQVWEKGGAGELLAQQVVTAIDEQPGNYRRLYQNEESLPDKAAKIVKEIYGGSNVVFSSVAQRQLNVFKKWLASIADLYGKTQYSFSDDPQLLGAPADFSITIREFVPKLGAGFIVALTGTVMTMPGLPKKPAALNMDVDADGNVSGLLILFSLRICEYWMKK